jgi:hypothetical protein
MQDEARPAKPPRDEVHIAGDPVLRLALMKLGIITPMSLDEAEMWMREASRQGKALTVTDGQFTLEDL